MLIQNLSGSSRSPLIFSRTLFTFLLGLLSCIRTSFFFDMTHKPSRRLYTHSGFILSFLLHIFYQAREMSQFTEVFLMSQSWHKAVSN